MVMHFTQDRVIDTFLPAVEPTDRTVQLPVAVVVGFDGDRVVSEHVYYWHQASLLVQVGLADPGLPCNALIERATDGCGQA